MDKIGSDTSRKFPSIALLAIILLSLCLVNLNGATAQIDQANSKLQAANAAIDEAFIAVLDAEKASANVTGLLVQLNTAQNILAQAENAYRTGDTIAAQTKADSVLPIAQQVTLNAQEAKQTATIYSQNAFSTSIILSIVGIVVFILVLFLVWRLFKQKYIQQLSNAKPEVVNQ